MAALCSGKFGTCENEAKILGLCKSCRQYHLRYGGDERKMPAGVVVISDIQHRIGSHGLVYRKAATGGWVRSTKSLEEFTSAQLPKKRKKK